MIFTNVGRKILTKQNVSSTTYIYTSNASSGANDGWQDAKYDGVVAQIGVATLTATACTYRIEGRNGTINRPGSILVGKVTTADAIDNTFLITEPYNELRIGVKTSLTAGSPLASPNIMYTGFVLTGAR